MAQTFSFEEAVAPPPPESKKGPATFSFEDARTPLGAEPPQEGFFSRAGSALKSVYTSPQAAADATTGDPMGSGASEMLAQPTAASKSIFNDTKMEPPTNSAEANRQAMDKSASPDSVMFDTGRALQGVDSTIARAQARAERAVAQEDAKTDVGSLASLGRGYGKAVGQTGKALNLAIAAPVVVWNTITKATDTPVQDALFRNLLDPAQKLIDWNSLQPNEKQGFLAKVSEGIGALANDLPMMILSGGASAETKLAQAFPTLAEHIGNVTSRGFDAMRPLMIKSAVEKAEQVLESGGTPQDAITSATTAALLTGFMGGQPMSAEGPLLARVLTGIPVGAASSEAHRVIQNVADPANLQQPFSAEGMAVGAVTNAAMAGAMGHAGAPRARADRIDLGYDPLTGKTATAQAAQSYAGRPAEFAPGRAEPLRDPLAKISEAKTADDVIKAATDAVAPGNSDAALAGVLHQDFADQLRTLINIPKAPDVSNLDAAGRVDARPGGQLDPLAAGSGLDTGRVEAPPARGEDRDAAALGERSPAGEPVPVGDQSDAALAPRGEPTATWFGRRGDGYLTRGDAEMAIPSRQRVSPELNWSVETTPTGKFRLAGYDEAAPLAKETAPNLSQEAPAAALVKAAEPAPIPPETFRQLGDLRTRKSVLDSLLECLG